MRQQNIFEKLTGDEGGRDNNQTDDMNWHIEQFKILLNRYADDPHLLKKFPQVEVDFVDNNGLDAFADQENGDYIIGIFRGTYFILWDLFDRLLSHKHMFQKIGNPDLEDELPPFIGYYDHIDDLVKSGHKGDYKPIEPKDDTRRRFAMNLTFLAMLFIFEHELSHILFGHVDLLQKEYSLRRFPLSNKLTSIFDEDNFNMQTLEMDADGTALARCCNHVVLFVQKPLNAPDHIRDFYPDIYTAFSHLNFAILNIFLLFGDGDYFDTTLGKSTHPDPRIRQLMLSATFESVAKIRPELNLDTSILQDVILKSTHETNLGYEYLSGNSIDKGVFRPEFYSNNPLPDAVSENWENKMRGKLEQYSFKPLAD